MAKELEVVKQVKYDKQDIVTVALAKIENKIRKTVREAKAEVKMLDNEVANLKQAIPKIRNANIPPAMTKKMVVLNKTIKSVKLGKMVEWCINSEGFRDENMYRLQLVSLDEKGRYEKTLTAYEEATLLIKSQRDVYKAIEKANDLKRTALARGVEWKAKLTEMPAAERQMRAKICEAELNKTTDGKAILKVLVENYEDTIKQISMT